MDITEAVKIISKEAPCRHDSYEECGIGSVKCCDCDAAFNLQNKYRYDEAADKFDAAIDAIMALDELVNPKPQMVEKEVKVYASVDSTTGRVRNVGSKEQLEIEVSPAPSNLLKIVELTGTYQAPANPKVKRRIDLGETRFDDKRIIMQGAGFYDMANRPQEIANKTGRFIFEYEE